MYKRILAPMDGSELSECSLDHIKTIAIGCKNSEVILLTVLESPMPPSVVPSSKQATDEIFNRWRSAEQESQQKAENYLATVADNLKKEGMTVKTIVETANSIQGAAENILDYADNNNVDLIIMSTHGRSGISRWTLGSVTDKVVRHAKAPVLTVAPASCRTSQLK